MNTFIQELKRVLIICGGVTIGVAFYWVLFPVILIASSFDYACGNVDDYDRK